jgi:hypothetical protein
MGFAASNKSVVAAVKSPVRRAGRFFQTKRSIDRLPATNARQSVRTSTNPAQSVGKLSDSRKVK